MEYATLHTSGQTRLKVAALQRPWVQKKTDKGKHKATRSTPSNVLAEQDAQPSEMQLKGNRRRPYDRIKGMSKSKRLGELLEDDCFSEEGPFAAPSAGPSAGPSTEPSAGPSAEPSAGQTKRPRKRRKLDNTAEQPQQPVITADTLTVDNWG
ncbi:hypothetical protein ABBQ32_004318 [Trebouxia sp. C0010 RCD-2024]